MQNIPLNWKKAFMPQNSTATDLNEGVYQSVPVHFDDLDIYHMVYHGKYPSLFERALTAYWTRIGITLAELHQVVRTLQLTYEAPITGVGEVAVHFFIDHVGRTSYRYGFRILSQDRSLVHATGTRVQVNLNPETLRPAPFDAQALALAQPLLTSAARL
ncbi:acyl-CoA thioesterase [Streptomyces zaomyceticus]|uniref:acyl-CoA thioesterase n=1 Tax=Streptomyces zaomyceticus TaxID=68286 RepID=UPI0036A5DA98